MIELRPITEDIFLDAFNLKLASGQEAFVSHPIRSLAQAYVYREQCQPFGIYADGIIVGYVMVIYDYDVPEYDIWLSGSVSRTVQRALRLHGKDDDAEAYDGGSGDAV